MLTAESRFNGKFGDAASGKTFDSVNPATGAVLTAVVECNEEVINRAVAAGRTAFEDGRCSSMVPGDLVLVKSALGCGRCRDAMELPAGYGHVESCRRFGRRQLGGLETSGAVTPVRRASGGTGD